MSHFTVMLMTPGVQVPNHEQVKAAMMPWHEFECTGLDNEYVQDVDITEEARETWLKDTTTVITHEDGTKLTLFNEDGNYRDMFAQPGDHGRRKKFVPAGWTESEEPTKDHVSLATFACGYFGGALLVEGAKPGEDHKYGYALIDTKGELVKMINRTNPNAKWDWFQVGGRWKGHLLGTNGFKVDQCPKGTLGLDKMRGDASDEAETLWAKVHDIVAGLERPKTWEEVFAQEELSIEERRELYRNQPMVKALNEAFPDNWGIDEELKAALSTREEFKAFKANGRLSTYALVDLDGNWHQRGQMGWWGMSSDEMTQEEWDAHFNKVIDEAPTRTCLTVIDCHI